MQARRARAFAGLSSGERGSRAAAARLLLLLLLRFGTRSPVLPVFKASISPICGAWTAWVRCSCGEKGPLVEPSWKCTYCTTLQVYGVTPGRRLEDGV